MSNGIGELTTELKARLFVQFGKVSELIRERKRNGEEVSKILQAIIGNDEIHTVPKNGYVRDRNCFRISSDYKDLYEIRRDYPSQSIDEDDIFTIQKVYGWVRVIPNPKKGVDELIRGICLASPIELITFGRLHLHSQVLAGKSVTTFWRSPSGTLWLAKVHISTHTVPHRRSLACRRADLTLDSNPNEHPMLLVRA